MAIVLGRTVRVGESSKRIWSTAEVVACGAIRVMQSTAVTRATSLHLLRSTKSTSNISATTMKRNASKAALTSSKSSFNPSVTLFSLDNSAASTSTLSPSTSKSETSGAIATRAPVLDAVEVSEDGPRRSKRVKRVHTTLEERDEDAVLTEVTETVIPDGPLTIRRSPRKSEVKKEEPDSDEALPTPRASPKGKGQRKPSASRKTKSVAQSLDTPHPAPERWRETYDAIKEMRSKITAPVDTMGCDRAQYKETEPKVRLWVFRSFSEV